MAGNSIRTIDEKLDIRVKGIMKKPLLERIQELAYLCFSPSEIALLCGLDVEIFTAEIAYNTTDRASAYHVGKMRYKLKQRLVISDAALKGSATAILEMKRFANKQTEEEHE